MKKSDLDFFYDEELKARPKDPQAMTDYVDKESELISKTDINGLSAADAKLLVSKLGYLANYLKMLRRADKAHEFYKLSDELINRFGFDEKTKLVNKIRWADNYRCNRQLAIAETWFLECYHQTLKSEAFWNYEDFCLQHLGKLYFDKQQYAKALDAFAKTLNLRLDKADKELLDSTTLAIQTTRKKIRKIAVIGNSCSGKTTLSLQLRDLFQLPIFHVDSIQYLAGLKWRNPDETRTILTDISQSAEWIIDGLGPLKILEDRMKKADLIIVLRPPISVLFFRLIVRQLMGIFTRRPELPEGCFESTPSQTWKMLKTIRNVDNGLWPQLDRILKEEHYCNKVIGFYEQKPVRDWIFALKYSVQ